MGRLEVCWVLYAKELDGWTSTEPSETATESSSLEITSEELFKWIEIVNCETSVENWAHND